MSPAARAKARSLADQLESYRKQPLVGASTDDRRHALAMQLVEGQRRIEFVEGLVNSTISPERADPASTIFDPIRAALLKVRAGEFDEACWLVFLATHFGKSIQSGWRLVSDTYGSFNGGQVWTWHLISNNPAQFRDWAIKAQPLFSGADGVKRVFSNHRQYEPIKMDSARGLPRVVESYVQWVGANRGHEALIADAVQKSRGSQEVAFDYLYNSMKSVVSFGRLARFDYLTMLGKLGLAAIEPGSPYLKDSTGPQRGARLLFDGSATSTTSIQKLDEQTVELGRYLNLRMQVMEDAVCNWQKSPSRFIAFRG